MMRGGAVWSARRTHDPKVGGSNPSPATCLSDQQATGVLHADVAHLVERDLAKVEVAGSIPVIRSTLSGPRGLKNLLGRVVVMSRATSTSSVTTPGSGQTVKPLVFGTRSSRSTSFHTLAAFGRRTRTKPTSICRFDSCLPDIRPSHFGLPPQGDREVPHGDVEQLDSSLDCSSRRKATPALPLLLRFGGGDTTGAYKHCPGSSPGVPASPGPTHHLTGHIQRRSPVEDTNLIRWQQHTSVPTPLPLRRGRRDRRLQAGAKASPRWFDSILRYLRAHTRKTPTSV